MMSSRSAWFPDHMPDRCRMCGKKQPIPVGMGGPAVSVSQHRSTDEVRKPRADRKRRLDALLTGTIAPGRSDGKRKT